MLVPVFDEDGEMFFIEFDEDGVPLGMWTWDPEEEMWIFDEDVPLGMWEFADFGDFADDIPKENPQTGQVPFTPPAMLLSAFEGAPVIPSMPMVTFTPSPAMAVRKKVKVRIKA
jgi:hypothetical protein